MRMRLFIAAGTFCALFSVAALAQPGTGQRMRDLAKQADANHDRQLTFEEIKAVAPKMTQERFDAMDQDKDGVLTRADREAAAAHRKTEADRQDGEAGQQEGKPGHRNAGADRPNGARPQPGAMLERLRTADADKDGKVTREEFDAQFKQAPSNLYARLDRNGDGVLTPADAPAGPGNHPGEGLAERLKKADTDGDGKVTRKEARVAMPHAPEELIGRLDRNGDGVLSAEDLQGKSGPKGRPEALHALRKADTNGDGVISRKEFKTALPQVPEARFDALDANGDGLLSKPELPKAREQAARDGQHKEKMKKKTSGSEAPEKKRSEKKPSEKKATK